MADFSLSPPQAALIILTKRADQIQCNRDAISQLRENEQDISFGNWLKSSISLES